MMKYSFLASVIILILGICYFVEAIRNNGVALPQTD